MAESAPAENWEEIGANLDRVLRLVGHVNYAWSNTESLLIHFIAGLAAVDKETATILYLSLNTSRARLDLVKRLARAKCDDPKLAKRIIGFANELSHLGKQRNVLNHCLYAFDSQEKEIRTIEMRLADTTKGLKMGRQQVLDDAEMVRISATIDKITKANSEAWSIIQTYHLPH